MSAHRLWMKSGASGRAVDFEVTLVEKISSDLTEILEYGVPITIHNSKKPSVHEEGLQE